MFTYNINCMLWDNKLYFKNILTTFKCKIILKHTYIYYKIKLYFSLKMISKCLTLIFDDALNKNVFLKSYTKHQQSKCKMMYDT